MKCNTLINIITFYDYYITNPCKEYKKETLLLV